jgi:mono/diheme cytochrome c family protein
MKRQFFTFTLAWLAIALPAVNTQAASDEELFIDKVYPLMKEKCLACHGDRPDKIKGGYDMRTYKGLLAGGDSGEAAIVKGRPDQSPFFVALTWADEDLQMPPKENDRLDKAELAVFREWIERGAPWSDPNVKRALAWGDVSDDGMVVRTRGGLDDSWTYRRYAVDGLWAYQPIAKIESPRADVHPVDAFVDARLTEAGVKVAPRAEKLDLLRRATFGLTGLPPTPAEVKAFLDDGRPDAFDGVVDRLLGSSHYGEKMAQHWLDVVRYADTSGFSNDFERPTAWRYRDYVVRSFNSDKPYDQFVREQLAGDELSGAGPEGQIAAGFLRMGPWEHTSMSVAAETRQQFLDDVTHSVGVTFLGQQLRCCKCHDHKFDPLPTQDYYSFQALFATVQFADRSLSFLENENTRQMATGKARLQRRMKNANNRDKYLEQQVQNIVARQLQEKGPKGMSGEERKQAYELAMKDQKIAVGKATRKQKMYYEREGKRYEPYAFTVYNGPARVAMSTKPIMAMPKPAQRKGKPEAIHVLTGGSIESPAQEVSPNILSVVGGFASPDSSLTKSTFSEGMRGRRAALANWIVDRENPLTARVMVNRVWQHLFSGQALAGTPNDFGKMGKQPTHPELLDYLARWFMDNGWSVKKLQRFIMASETYQRAAAPVDPEVTQTDGANQWLSYFPPRRLQAEELRDGMLAITGELNREQGGPGTFPEINWEVAFQPRLVMGTIAPAYQPSPTRAERHRRALYHFRYRSLADPLLEVFNRPGSEMACDVRDETIIAPQAFALFNSEFVHNRALALAALAQKNGAAFPQRLNIVYRRLFGRTPSAKEAAVFKNHFERTLEHHRASTPVEEPLPLTVERESVEELTGEPFVMVEELDNLKNYERDLKPWDVNAETRALAEVCLVLLNSNEFSFLY